MERKSEEYLKHWFFKKNRKPLVIRGARQVGKSTLVRQFCKNQKLECFEINLERHVWLDKVFKTYDTEKILIELSDVMRKTFDVTSGKKILLFLDEIQATPHAIPALRYLYEEHPHLAVIAAGSLLEFVLSDHDFSMPVGRIEYLHVGPMTFQEFLKALSEEHLLQKLRNIHVETKNSISEAAHNALLQKFREYLFVGGMPEAIQVFLEEKHSWRSVSEVHARILETYRDDMGKYSKKAELSKTQLVFNLAPLNVGKKIKYVNFSKDYHGRDLKQALHLLSQAKILTPVVHSNCSGLPLESGAKHDVYKILFLDVGLMNAALRTDPDMIRRVPHEKLLTDGMMAEQFMGQHLLYLDEPYISPKIYYWLREGKAQNAEVDYVLAHKSQIVAIEVKAGAIGKLRSLHQWMYSVTHKKKQAVRFDVNRPFLQEISHGVSDGTAIKNLKYTLVSLPLYCVEELPRILGEL